MEGNTGYLVTVSAAGTIERERFDIKDYSSQLNRCVGGWLELAPVRWEALPKGFRLLDLFVNEEGALNGMRPNMMLSRLCGRPIFGAGVFAAREEVDTVGLNEQECEYILKQLTKEL